MPAGLFNGEAQGLMTRAGSTKRVDKGHGGGRLAVARAFLKAARDTADLAQPGDVANPIIATIVHAAIAYADALTARHAGLVNRQDHSAAPKVLRDALGNRFPKAQETILRRILEQKDAAAYGARRNTVAEARDLLVKLEDFAKWAETAYGNDPR